MTDNTGQESKTPKMSISGLNDVRQRVSVVDLYITLVDICKGIASVIRVIHVSPLGSDELTI